MHLVAGLIIVLVLGAGGYFAYQSVDGGRDSAGTSTEQTESDNEAEPEARASADIGVSFTWRLTDAGEDPLSGAPRTKVELVHQGQVHDLGVQTGSCAEIAGSSWQPIAGEVSGVICWFAGGGTEFGVFENGGTYVVKQGQLDEGTAEIPGMRGGFETVLRLKDGVE